LDMYLFRVTHPKAGKSAIRVGDVVLVTPYNRDPLRVGKEATVHMKGKDFLILALSQRLRKGLYRVDLYVNDTTFRRMEEALDNLQPELLEILLKRRRPREGREAFPEKVAGRLNESQREALSKALGSEFFLLHGPPGTGKTTTLSAIIHAFVEKGQKVLATADSNTAVDNLAEKLMERGLSVVRVGNPARVSKALLEQTLTYKLLHHPRAKALEGFSEAIAQLRERQASTLPPKPSVKRGLGKELIMKLAKANKGSRGVPASKIKAMAKWYAIQDEIAKLREEKERVEREIIKDIVEGADVVLSTNSGSYSEALEPFFFDVAVVDEATQATEPSTLMPLTKAQRWVMAGDHKQLPPTVISEDERLKVSLFERLAYFAPTHMLTIQYRMNERLMAFPSRKFYNGRLKAHPSVRNIRLSDLISFSSLPPKKAELWDEPLLFIPIRGQERGGVSKANEEEARAVFALVDVLLSLGLPPSAVGVITPYKEQRDLLAKLEEKGVEVNTVDGFQGREKEVIILSLVRANREGAIGFLRDERRLNVAITRAKRKLIILGHPPTLEKHPLYKELLEECRWAPLEELLP